MTGQKHLALRDFIFDPDGNRTYTLIIHAQNMNIHRKKISISRCKEILARNGNNYDDEQIERIRDFLYFIVEMESENFVSTKKRNEREPGITGTQLMCGFEVLRSPL